MEPVFHSGQSRQGSTGGNLSPLFYRAFFSSRASTADTWPVVTGSEEMGLATLADAAWMQPTRRGWRRAGGSAQTRKGWTAQ